MIMFRSTWWRRCPRFLTAVLSVVVISYGNRLRRAVVPAVLLGVVFCLLVSGCGQTVPSADPAPFDAAVSRYLAKNDMALRLKEIRQGPTVDGNKATMVASMTHRELGGPSVVWTFQFKRRDRDEWTVLSHSDK